MDGGRGGGVDEGEYTLQPAGVLHSKAETQENGTLMSVSEK